MKVITIKRFRKIISKQGNYEKRLKCISDLLEDWHHFYTFKCDDFFVGYEKAEYNIRIYRANALRLQSKYEWYCKKTIDDKKVKSLFKPKEKPILNKDSFKNANIQFKEID